MKCLYLIPARGGSKGIPKKNIKLFNGKPLIHYSIEFAKKLTDSKDICVSTDSEEIKKVAEQTGIHVPFIRPADLATDKAGSSNVIKHAVEFYKAGGVNYDAVILLQPTSPFRLIKHVKEAITIFDDGRGIPVDFHPKYKNKRAFEIVLTTLHAGGKFSDNVYKTSGGLHGVGISVVNALSEKLEVKVFNKSKIYSQTYERGQAKSKVKIEKCNKKLRGTEISFIPDKNIFESIEFSPKKLYSFIKMKSVLVKGTKISFSIDKILINDKTPSREDFFYSNH